ncbi:MAG: MerR family transcriptional regulator, partial [Actinomyces sp.]
EELVAVGLISPDVRGRYSQQNLRTVRLAMEITRKGVPLRNLRAVRASAEREADTIDQAVAPRRSRSRSAGEETARELAELVADLHTILLRRAVDALG